MSTGEEEVSAEEQSRRSGSKKGEKEKRKR